MKKLFFLCILSYVFVFIILNYAVANANSMYWNYDISLSPFVESEYMFFSSSPEDRQILDKEKFYSKLIKNTEGIERHLNICLYAYYRLKMKNFGPPKKVLGRNIDIAQEAQESWGNPSVVSKKGAFTSWQITTPAIKDVFGYGKGKNKVISFLEEIRKKKYLDFSGSVVLNNRTLEKMENFLKKNPEHEVSKAIRWLYLAKLWTKKNEVKGCYGVGRQHFEKGNFILAGNELLAAYNSGHKVKNKHKEKWLPQARIYVKEIRKKEVWVEKILSNFPRLSNREVIVKMKKIFMEDKNKRRNQIFAKMLFVSLQ